MILVTGSDGFVGRNYRRFLASKGESCVCAVRRADPGEMSAGTTAVGDIDSRTDWLPVLRNVRTVVHLAARVHVFGREAQALDQYREVNVSGSVNLARQAANSGVRRFVYVSTVKVHGEESGDEPFKASDNPAPADWYSVSKLEAEEALSELCRDSNMELVIIRPPLIYGQGVKGNFARLVKLVRRGYWLPLGMIRNRRSLLGIDNFCSLLDVCANHPAASGKIFLASDGQDVSTPDLIRLIAKHCDVPARLLPVPVSILELAAGLMGKGTRMSKLTGSLQVDCSTTRQLLDWTPPYTLEQGIARSV